ncbi:uncharacterized protein METZ01_LOCUS516786, partial [marine metagenome]
THRCEPTAPRRYPVANQKRRTNKKKI